MHKIIRNNHTDQESIATGKRIESKKLVILCDN